MWARTLSMCLAVLSLSGCGGSSDERLIVFAASSLTDVFDQVERQFEAAHPGVDVIVNYGGSSSLAGQIEQGAPADVFAAADLNTMERVRDEADGDPTVFAHNRLAIAVEPGNPLGISGLASLADGGLLVVVADSEVPAGAYAAEALQLAGVTVEPVSYESNVRAVAAKVALGEADAGIVYRTDIVADDARLDEVVIPDAYNVIADYPIVVVREGEAAQSFVAFTLDGTGRDALADAGFELP
jgi:molybdate transport system substrate-binding protein